MSTLTRLAARGLAGAAALILSTAVFAHGDVTPQAVDTKSLPQLGETWKGENPYRGNKPAIKIGESAYTQNCARCHGIDAISGGIAPDLRLMDRDCATMANKGLELIEAAYLFDMPGEQVDVVVHPESIIHSLVEYVDGSTLAQMGPPDMRTPIACALSWPDRLAWPAPRLDLASLGRLTFEAPDEARFPALRLAREALAAGDAAPIVFNAANEVAALAFLDRRLGFLNIAAVVADTLEKATSAGVSCGSDDACDAALAVDAQARRIAGDVIASLNMAA